LFYCSEECLSKDLLIHKFECRAYRRGWKQGKQIDDDSDEFEYSDSFYNLQDFLKDSDDLHLLRVLSVLHNNEIFHKQMQSTYGGIKSVFNSVGALYADNIENIDSVVSHFEAQSVTSYPRLVPFADLTPIERIFDLVGHAHSTETELEEQKNIIYKALTFLKFF
jgi:hypothetical protein